MEIRNSRRTGLSRYRFKIRGEGGIAFDYVVVTITPRSLKPRSEPCLGTE
jgi:hypothetical protein